MSKKIGFIGVGNMGSAIIRGLASRDVELHGVDHDADKLAALDKEFGVISHDSPLALANECDVIVVAVKPQHAEPVVKEIAAELGAAKCLVSICAGITLSRFKDWSEGVCPVVRVMPNTPALVSEGVFAVCLDDRDLSTEMKTFIPGLFQGIGQVHILPEKLFDAFTGVIGSGPAYVFYFMEALIESGVALGLSRTQSTEMVKGLFSGSAKLAAQSDLSIPQLREMVTSPGGTTIRALMHFDRQGVRGDIIDGVFESYLRSIELGE
ncbi:MAG: pyrroline-5-carboxylate reductase [Pseudodesulfovibrio sp.]|uniref:Pyrroline-5-carboxylate reductase n=1 Tax=Pseudodesulfovibrio aespoeensis (strain ATCC 700646 / DSM 10631 / Aspo-2) TaxID=643562 RepID=E6VWM0_PSEA9|nr:MULTISPECIES: pyrroline-5-carboxylate reductase [Pseudodesulfovibrio]MBU4190953.1 pyrroline-5-carboxylate reductase [Pseudomonadota bacterium]ADU62521.1 pyrroline-5-carboxylate reductase [Pseudodesulfovibrio aespoeensis Aspo-2]MBU4242724.1 pyrroline-5-carboxylate reductase [Pseudomonadota bacterium]MBU4377817.1 pyrroline-5-carboxylate reductase [Pseudomonadota bacterium]MBU4473875.1 pyrroline-5-carboxylate reductase [Pseudomonadota bacterium]